MEPQAWGYYSSGGDDEITLRDNHMARAAIDGSACAGYVRDRNVDPCVASTRSASVANYEWGGGFEHNM